MATAPVLRRKPEARAESVEDLVEKTMGGLVRVPSFQRGLNWQAKDVVGLLDSVYRGYPIGSLLLWKRPAEATRISLGPLTIEAPETSSAFWVVDGQQRLTALSASLARPMPLPSRPVDPYVVYFDPQNEQFHSPPSGGNLPTTWVAVPLLLDATRLSEWLLEWPHQREAHLRGVLFEAGERLREYPVSLYIVDSDDEVVLREIFFRVNSSGQRLEWEEIHEALFAQAGKAPSSLDSLGDALGELGMGRIENDALLQCLLAQRGLDVTSSLAEHRRRDPDVLRDAVPEALPPLRRALSFLRRDAEIPHVRLLPRGLPLVILTRFFALHAEPNARTRGLLTRWVWRLFAKVGSFDERTMLRKGVRAMAAGTEEDSVQELLKLVPVLPRPSFVMPPSYDARAAANRIVLVALAALRPRHLVTGELLDIAGLVEGQQAEAFRAIVTNAGSNAAKTAANRIIHPGEIAIGQALRERTHEGRVRDEVLASHAIGPVAAEALARGDTAGFLACRHDDVTTLVNEMCERLAAWSHSDRPSIAHLLAGSRTQP